MSVLEKTFAQVLVEFNTDIRKAKAALDDKRLSAVEKLILQNHLKIRDNKNEEVINNLSHLTPSYSNFVEAHRLMILGSAFNNLTQFHEAKQYLEKAVTLFQKHGPPYFSFHASFTLFWIYANLEDLDSMKVELERMELIAPQDDKQNLKFLRSQFCYFQLADKEMKAQEVLDEIDGRFGEMNEDDKIRHLVDKFIFFVQMNNLTEAKDILDQSKKYRKFSLSENYNYMKKMLDHLMLNTALYVYEKDFQCAPILYDQIKCIQYLEEKNILQAKDVWAKLNKCSPGIFKEFLNYAGKRSLFSLCLEKHKLEQLPKLHNVKAYPSKLDALVSHLSKATVPLRAAYLFELIWGEPPQDKEDLKKVSRLVYRAKIELALEIEFRKGTYLLKPKSYLKSS